MLFLPDGLVEHSGAVYVTDDGKFKVIYDPMPNPMPILLKRKYRGG